MIYVAGSLFTESEIAMRITEANYIRSIYSGEVFNPIEAPINDKGDLPSAEDIALTDMRKILQAKGYIFNFDNPLDAGVYFEYGMVYDKDRPLVIVMSDIRIKNAGEYDGVRVPYGFNQMVVGAAKLYDHVIYDNYKDACDALVKELRNIELRETMPF